MRYATNALRATALALPLGFAGAAAAQAAGVVETIQGQPQLQTLYQALQQAGMVEQLSGGEAVTVFAPTDEAFEALPDETLAALLAPENQDALRTLLNYHVVQGRTISSTELPEQVETEAGTLYIGLLEGRPTIARSEPYGYETYRTAEPGQAAAGAEAAPGELVQAPEATSPAELQDEAPLAQAEVAEEREGTATGLVGQEPQGDEQTLTEMLAGDEEAEAAGAFEEEETRADLLQEPEVTSPTELQDEAPQAQQEAAETGAATGTMGQDAASGLAESVTGIVSGDAAGVEERQQQQQATAAPGGALAYDEAAVTGRFGAEPEQGASIVEADIQADNGVIHVIDYVLVPNNVIEAMLD